MPTNAQTISNLSTMSRRLTSAPMTYRSLVKLLLCLIIVSITSAVIVADDSGEYGERNDIQIAVKTATISLQREVNALKERLELFEMKHETLQAVSDQLRLQSKSTKSKLDEERKRYETLASEKLSLEVSLETKLSNALEEQKLSIEDTMLSNNSERQTFLEKENGELVEKVRRLEEQLSVAERRSDVKSQDQYKRYDLLEKKKEATDKKLQSQIIDFKQRLSRSETQTRSFEESWKEAIAELDAKDELLQEESKKRVEEASRWEQRIYKLNTESTSLLSELQRKEDELKQFRNVHTSLLENVRKSGEQLLTHEAQIEERNAMNTALQTELLDTNHELEIIQNKTKESMKEQSKLTKAYTEALDKLTSENSKLHNELITVKFELENSQNKTNTSNQEMTEITKLQQNTAKNLESERKELDKYKYQYTILSSKHAEITMAEEKLLQQLEIDRKKVIDLTTENTKLGRDYTMITAQSNRSTEEAKELVQRFNEEVTKKTEIQNELAKIKLQVESSQSNDMELKKKHRELSSLYEEIKQTLRVKESKLLELNQNYQIIYEHDSMLQKKVDKLDKQFEEHKQELELKDSKNSYMQKTLLDTKYKLDISRDEIRKLEGQIQDSKKYSNTEIFQLEIERDEITQQKNELDREVKESSALRVKNIQEISFLREKLNFTVLEVAKFSDMYESLQVEKDIIDHNLTTASLTIKNKISAFERCDANLRDTQSQLKTANDSNDLYVRTMKLQLKEKREAQQLCDRELDNAKSSLKVHNDTYYSNLHTLNLKADEAEKALKQCDEKFNITAETRKHEIERFNNELRDRGARNFKLVQDLNNATKRIEQNDEQIKLQQNTIDQVAEEKAKIEIIALQRKNNLTEARIENLELIVSRNTANGKLVETESIINSMENLFLLQETEVTELQERTAIMEKLLVPRILVGEINENDSRSSNSKEPTQDGNISKYGVFQNFWKPLAWLKIIVGFIQRIDFALYRILRVIVDYTEILGSGIGKLKGVFTFDRIHNGYALLVRLTSDEVKSFFTFDWIYNGSAASLIVQLITPLQSVLSIVLWAFNELRIIHDAVVSLFEFEMTFISSLLSSERDRTRFSFFIRHSEMFVIFGEIIVALLCIDFIISFFLDPKRRKRRPKARTIHVPKATNASLLRKAKNI